MAVHRGKIKSLLQKLMAGKSVDALKSRLSPNLNPASPKLRHATDFTPALLAHNWNILKKHAHLTHDDEATLCADKDVLKAYGRNIENPVGLLKLPIGVAGPLRINGLFAHGDFYVPLATTEAALVASYARGAALITASGGATSLILNDTMTRAPSFGFKTLIDAIQFVMWLDEKFENLQTVAAKTSRFGRLNDMRITMEGNHVYVNFDFVTGNAAGQNMVTLATDAINAHILAHCPIRPELCFVESNFSGDKKASSVSFLSVRGKKVTAEVIIPKAMIEKTLHTTVGMMIHYALMACNGGIMSGTMGVQGHFANGIAALYLATGQDVACVAESSVGVTRLEETEDGDLYASVTLPNIVVGTVGGGTGLPTQQVGLKMLGLKGEHSALALAEIVAVTCLAGEISIMGAICAGDFAKAHGRLARGKGQA